jgi:hypothetical protein
MNYKFEIVPVYQVNDALNLVDKSGDKVVQFGFYKFGDREAVKKEEQVDRFYILSETPAKLEQEVKVVPVVTETEKYMSVKEFNKVWSATQTKLLKRVEKLVGKPVSDLEE